mgnify:CR=1 FL=1
MIYFTRLSVGEIWLLLMYTKSRMAAIPSHLLKAIVRKSNVASRSKPGTLSAGEELVEVCSRDEC